MKIHKFTFKLAFIFTISIFSSCNKNTNKELSENVIEDQNQNLNKSKSTQSAIKNSRSEAEENDAQLSQNEILQKELFKEEKPDWLNLGAVKQSELIDSREYVLDQDDARGRNYLHGAISVVIEGVTYKLPDDFKANSVSYKVMNDMVALRKNTEARIYKIHKDELVYMPEIPLPQFNFGEERRWYLSDWQWIDQNNLIVISNEENPETDMISDSRVYTYNLNSQTLQRVNLPTTLEVTGGMKLISVDGNTIHVRNRDRLFQINLQ